MKISFIVVACHRPDSLRTCLSSLVEQSFTDFEIVVVDNSTSAAVIEENIKHCTMDGRIRYVNTASKVPANGNHAKCLYTATEIGVGESSGEWLCFPNDDSYYTPAFAERLMVHAAGEGLEFVYSDIVLGRHDRVYHGLSCAPHNCAIDKTCFIVKREWFNGFPHKETMYDLADGLLVDELVARGIKHGKVGQCLVVHN